jgi:hypothetical protein
VRRRVATEDEDNGLAPLGSMLVKVGTLDGAGEPTSDTGKPVPYSARPAAAAPSWGRVLATTIKLWVRRRWRVLAAVVVAAAVAVTALAFSGAFTATAVPAAPAHPAGKGASQGASSPVATAPTTEAAAWVASQVSGDTIIACDAAVCTALQARGVSAGRLMPLKPGSPDPHGAAVVVSSSSASAVSQYAPAMMASFGSGDAQVDVRAAEPGGAGAYQSALRSDLAARVSAGSQLLGNNRIKFTAQDAAQLRAGEVDARMLATLAALSSQHSFSVIAFGDAAPGTATLYREVTITSTAATNAAADLAADLALVNAQVQPYLPAYAAIVHVPAGQAALRVEFAEPSPLGLLTAVLDEARIAS